MRFVSLFVIMCVFVMLTAGCTLKEKLNMTIKTEEPKSRVLLFSHSESGDGSRQKAAIFFADKVKEYSAGRLEVNVYESGQLSDDNQIKDLMKNGDVDFTVTGITTFADLEKSLYLTILPYLFDSYEQGWKFFDESTIVKGMTDKLIPKGMRILSVWESGFRIMTTREQVNSMNDLKGMKIRVPKNDMNEWTMTAFGMKPVRLGIGDVYQSIQQGTVNGQENPVDTTFAQKFTEVAPYVTMTKHMYSGTPIAISEKTWQSLSPQDQEAVMKAVKEATQFSRNEVVHTEKDQLKVLQEKGAKINNLDTTPFKKASEAVYDKAKQVYGDDTVKQFLTEVNKFKN